MFLLILGWTTTWTCSWQVLRDSFLYWFLLSPPSHLGSLQQWESCFIVMIVNNLKLSCHGDLHSMDFEMYNPTGISEKQSVNCLEKLTNTCKIAGAMWVMYPRRKTETELSLSCLYQAETVETLTNMQTAQSGAKCSISWQQYLRLDTALNCYN